MNRFPCLIRTSIAGGEARYALGDPLVDSYLAFVAGRSRPDTLRAVAHDLKTFFTVIDKDPVEVAAADVFDFVADQRGDRTVVRIREAEPGGGSEVGDGGDPRLAADGARHDRADARDTAARLEAAEATPRLDGRCAPVVPGRRNASTRSNELTYRATTAQWHAERVACRPKVSKLAANDRLRDYVQDRLAGTIALPDGELAPGPEVRFIGRRHGRRADRRWAKSWSPEQISNRLRVDFPEDGYVRISHEAIYQALYTQGRGALKRELVACLRTGRALRVPSARTRGRRVGLRRQRRRRPAAHAVRQAGRRERGATPRPRGAYPCAGHATRRGGHQEADGGAGGARFRWCVLEAPGPAVRETGWAWIHRLAGAVRPQPLGALARPRTDVVVRPQETSEASSCARSPRT
jgi:hypothetical protein